MIACKIVSQVQPALVGSEQRLLDPSSHTTRLERIARRASANYPPKSRCGKTGIVMFHQTKSPPQLTCRIADRIAL